MNGDFMSFAVVGREASVYTSATFDRILDFAGLDPMSLGAPHTVSSPQKSYGARGQRLNEISSGKLLHGTEWQGKVCRRLNMPGEEPWSGQHQLAVNLDRCFNRCCTIQIEPVGIV